MLQVSVSYTPGQPYRHELKARTHVAVSDVDPTLKGGDTGPTPHEYFLLSLGACAAMTIEMYAARKGWTFTKLTVTVTEDKTDDQQNSGKKIPYIKETVEIEGDLSDEQLAKLKEIGEKCPVKLLVTGAKVIELAVERSS